MNTIIECLMCFAEISGEVKYRKDGHPVCSQACVVADMKDARKKAMFIGWMNDE